VEIVNQIKIVGTRYNNFIAICTLNISFGGLLQFFNLSIEEIVQAKDYSLAEAFKPAFG